MHYQSAARVSDDTLSTYNQTGDKHWGSLKGLLGAFPPGSMNELHGEGDGVDQGLDYNDSSEPAMEEVEGIER